jgi:hypothetical protein
LNEHIEALKKATEGLFYDLFKLDHGDALVKVVVVGWANGKRPGRRFISVSAVYCNRSAHCGRLTL